MESMFQTEPAYTRRTLPFLTGLVSNSLLVVVMLVVCLEPAAIVRISRIAAPVLLEPTPASKPREAHVEHVQLPRKPREFSVPILVRKIPTPLIPAPEPVLTVPHPTAVSIPIPVPRQPALPAPVITGSFETAPAPREAPPTLLVAQAGAFSTTAAPATTGGKVVQMNAFDTPQANSAKHVPARAAALAGFGTVGAPAKAAASSQPPPRVQTRPVEILVKPKPEYSEEGRRLGIEGEVVLDVIFHADGRLTVQAVRQSLGHGLDERAMAAAQLIRFRPTEMNGEPSDLSATLRVQFQLAR